MTRKSMEKKIFLIKYFKIKQQNVVPISSLNWDIIGTQPY